MAECTACGNEVDPDTIATCWRELPEDHPGKCCDCYEDEIHDTFDG